jgi:hypothetical protein
MWWIHGCLKHRTKAHLNWPLSHAFIINHPTTLAYVPWILPKHIFKTNWAAYFFDNMRIHQSTPKHEDITKLSENNQTHSSQVDRMWHTLRYLPPTNTGMRQHMVANSQGVIGCIVQDKKKIKSLGCRPCLVTMNWFLTSILTSSDVSII